MLGIGLGLSQIAVMRRAGGGQPTSLLEIPDGFSVEGRSAEMVAPEAIRFVPDFDAIGAAFGMAVPGGVYDRRMHEPNYLWSFGDPGSFTAPQNMRAAHLSSDEAEGFAAAHVYRSPGTYTVRMDAVYVSEGTVHAAFSERTVTVGDPAPLFTGANTIFVSPSSDWTHAPSGAQRSTSLGEATEWANWGDGLAKRIVLNRGEAFAFAGRRFGFNSDSGPTVHIVAGPGEAAAPIVNFTGAVSSGGFSDETYAATALVVQGVVFAGLYDPVTPAEPEGASPAIASWGNYSPSQILIDRCEIINAVEGFLTGDATSTPRNIIFNDTVIHGYAQWGAIAYFQGSFAMLGCRVQSHVDAPADNGRNGGGPLRTGGPLDYTIISNTDFFSRQGWSPAGDYIAIQPCLRTEAGNASTRKTCITRCNLEGGFTMLSVGAGSNSEDVSGEQNTLVENNFFLGGHQTDAIFEVACGGTTIRNNVAVIPSPEQRTYGPSTFVNMYRRGAADILASRINIAGNIVVNLTGAPIELVRNAPGYTNVVQTDNVLHQPHLTPPQPSDIPLVASAPMWVPREKGYKSSAVPLIAATATPPDAAVLYSRA